VALLVGAAHQTPAQGVTGHPEPALAGFVYRGGMITPPLPKPEFRLIDTSGARFDFGPQTRGRVTLLFFGYTNCPSMCPTEMSTLAKVLKKLPADVAAQFAVVFVTTDPARDSPQALRTWLDHFDKRFIGLTGSESAIAGAQVAARVPPAAKSAVRPDGGYEVGHAAFVLAYTKDSLAHVLYPLGVTPADLEHDLPQLAKETWPGGR